MRIYYKIWADAIVQERSKKDRESSWKMFSNASMSILMGINLLTLLLLLRLLSGGRFLILFPMHLLKYAGLNTGISVLLTYFAPFIILNYLLVFNNNKYEEIIRKYGNRKGKLYNRYALTSFGIIVIPLLFKMMFL
ncbi:hypothetical protein [Mucilaginibacter sp. UR6-11]|uniref:hypothetical protein n=1 Tax=Mucilaginibacter sp. UR6-11 TaxID=1435644 RepID=UPI001E4BD7FC|nr:hypothetical protein [Mucilaginibacter sp. UR6-11]MCC8424597.1 hypothetical protein [Mucilaginibacter sp. UR6-11]